jgi:M-phase inducer tyrosine phosphatase
MSDIDPPSVTRYSEGYRRITAATFCAYFDSHPNFAKLIVVDCRSRGEYEGGHIKGAIRRHPFEGQFHSLYGEIYDEKALIVFHCEFSAFRAPAAIVEFTRQHADAGRDPATLHAFVLDGGYSQFWPKNKQYCDGGYVREMQVVGMMWSSPYGTPTYR